ncbi:unnamed protein product [Clonostachys rhizophaga]|uniref:Uncharacterized protein n=1 Tax=Clonostachys rhizophaga TaxID=160324 RepID=A0A9N9UXG2_9HYPO|nr:unnamed protein product [Clonostachys rhizophaga]
MKLPLIALAALLTGAHAAPVLKDSAVAPRKGNWLSKDNEALYRLNYPDYRDDNVQVPQADEVGQYSDDLAQFVEALREYYYKQAVKKSKTTTPRKKRVAKIAPSPDKKTLLKAILGKEDTRKGTPLRKKLSEKAAPKKTPKKTIPVRKETPGKVTTEDHDALPRIIAPKEASGRGATKKNIKIPSKKPTPGQKKPLKEVPAKEPATVQKPAPAQKEAPKGETIKKPTPVKEETPEKNTTEKSNPAQNDSTEKDKSTEKDTSTKKDSAPAQKDTSKEDSTDKKDPAP